MGKNEEIVSSLDDMSKEVESRDFQASIYFVKTLTATNVPKDTKYCNMMLPMWFVREHGDKFTKSVLLRFESSTKEWLVNIIVFCSAAYRSPEVKFGCGWREFSAANGLEVGDSVKFSLRAMSKFDVRVIFSESGNSIPRSSLQAPRMRSNIISDRLQESVANKSGGSRHRNPVAAIREGSTSDSSCEHCAGKGTVREEATFCAFCGATQISFDQSADSKLHFHGLQNKQDSSSSRCDSRNGLRGPQFEQRMSFGSAQQIGANRNHGERLQDVAFEETKELCPSFIKQVTASHFYGLEIPSGFLRTYGFRLRGHVELQGIDEDSPVHTVTCIRKKDRKRPRLFLSRKGWRDFRDENGLEVGQQLVFSLTADSFFVVRLDS